MAVRVDVLVKIGPVHDALVEIVGEEVVNLGFDVFRGEPVGQRVHSNRQTPHGMGADKVGFHDVADLLLSAENGEEKIIVIFVKFDFNFAKFWVYCVLGNLNIFVKINVTL